MNPKAIHINWAGPLTFEALKGTTLNDPRRDRGLYQVYGSHPLYGPSVLLYIGKAAEQTFQKRIRQESWEWGPDGQNLELYVGRIAVDPSGPPLDDEEWSIQVDAAEKLLIYAHGPASNTSNKNSIPKELAGVIVYNWEKRRLLFPSICANSYIGSFFEGDEDHWADYVLSAPDRELVRTAG